MFGAIITSTPEFQTSESQDRKSLFRRGLALACALGITAALLMGYAYLRWRNAEKLRTQEAALNPPQKPSPSPQVQVFVDEAMIKGPQVLLGGTVQNISSGNLTNITVELELKHRKDGKAETRTLTLNPADLNPNQSGRYVLNVLSSEFKGSRVLTIKSGQASTDVPFKIMPGAERPNERLQPKETIVVRPSPRRGTGEEFLNTPDTPVKVP